MQSPEDDELLLLELEDDEELDEDELLELDELDDDELDELLLELDAIPAG